MLSFGCRPCPQATPRVDWGQGYLKDHSGQSWVYYIRSTQNALTVGDYYHVALYISQGFELYSPYVTHKE